MSTNVFNFLINQYSDFTITLTVTQPNKSPLNLTGYTASASIKKSYFSSVSYPFTVEFVNRTSGIIALKMSNTQTSLLSGGRYVYDVIITDSNLKKTRAFEGIVTVMEGVTP